MPRNALARLVPLLLGLSLAISQPTRGGDDDDDEFDAPDSQDQILNGEHKQVSRALGKLLSETHTAFQKKDYDTALENLRIALRTIEPLKVQKAVKDEWEARFRYDLACARSLTGNKKEAIQEFTRAVDLGWSDWEHAKKDTDLDAIRKEADYEKAIENARAAHRERGVAEARKALDEKPLPDFDLDVKTIDAKQLKLADLKGKVVIVDVWATRYSARDLSQLESLVRLHERYKGKGLEIVGLACEPPTEGAAKSLEAFAKEHRIGYSLALVDWKVMKKKIAGLAGLPTTLYLDREGKVRLRKYGLSSSNTSHEWFEGVAATLLALKDEDGKKDEPKKPEK